MQVLLFVMTILMLMSIMTYGRLESFRNLAGAQGEFKRYMKVTERKFLNEQAQKRYTSITASQDEEVEKKEQQKNPATSKITFRFFINREEREKNEAMRDQFLLIAKNLMTFLYQSQEFFQEIANERPDFLNELLFALMKATENRTLNKPKDLSTVDLGDPKLHYVFYKMLAGTPEFEKDIVNFKPTVGYFSLLDFITIKPNKSRIRVYLASPQVLMAIFGDVGTVKEILAERYRLYRAVKKEIMTKEEASELFMSLFMEERLPGIENTLLDFGVSKTNPKTYEK